MISVLYPICTSELSLTSIKSILTQQFNNIELIFIVNSSIDFISDKLEDFLKDNRTKIVKYNSQDDFSCKINSAIRNAKGEYIYFHNLELILDENAFYLIDNMFNSHNADFLSLNYNIHLNNEVYSHFENNRNFDIYDDRYSIIENIFKFPIFKGSNIIRKSVLMNNNITFIGNFSNLFYKNLFHSKKAIISNDVLGYMEISSGNEFNKFLNNFDDYISVLDLFFKDKLIYEYFKVSLLEHILKNLNKDYLLLKYTPNSNEPMLINNVKNNFIKRLKRLFDKFYFEYRIYNDIKSAVSQHLFSFFEKFLINKNKYRLSIIVPIYNGEEYLKSTLDSIINQTLDFNTFEIILVDDCSTDGSKLIIERYCNEYENFKSIFLGKNSSYAGRPRNIALTEVSSDYVTFLDADDYFYIDSCENLYYAMICENPDIVIGNFTMDQLDGEKLYVKDNGIVYFNNLQEYSLLKFDSIDYNHHIITSSNVWNKLFKTNIIKNHDIKFPEGVPAEDSGFLFHYLLNSNIVLFINAPIVHYHNLRCDDGDTSVSHFRNKLNVTGRINVYNSMYNRSLEFNKEGIFVRYLLAPKLNYWFSQLVETDLSDEEFENIFREYKILFSKCVEYNVPLSNKYLPVFRNIAENDFNNAIKNIYLLKSDGK